MQLKITDAEKEGEEDPLPRIQKKMTSQTKCVISTKECRSAWHNNNKNAFACNSTKQHKAV